MKTRFVLAAMLLGGLVMMTACNKENTNEQLGIPEDALMLTTEDYEGDGKTAVEDDAVEWVNGDKVMVNGDEYTVTVTDAGAYINGASITGSVYGYYACGTVANGQSATPSVTIPSTYTCSYVDGKQVIALPMAAYIASVGSIIPFKHLTAAVKVRVWNAIENTTLVLDRVVVKSSTYLLSKEGKAISFASNGEPTVTPESTTTENAVTVNIEGNTTIASGSILDVQVPILPIGSGADEQLTIEVYTHETGNTGHTYTFRFTDGVPQGLERNAMLTAGCKIHTGEGNHVDEFDALNTPLTFEAKTAPIEIYYRSAHSSVNPSLEYSIDGGDTWETLNIESSSETGPRITLENVGDKVMLRGDNTQLSNSNGTGSFCSTGDCYIYGNVMSLLYATSYPTATTLSGQSVFSELFASNNYHPLPLYNHPYKTLVLPATTLTAKCYSGMFAGCEHLTTAPVLPATVLANDCYSRMFYACTSLTEAPALPATTLTQGCYNGMFVGCSSLTKAPDLSEVRTMTGISCCQEMFAYCTSLTTTPAMPTMVGRLQRMCYQGMFKGCTSLTTASALFGTAPTLDQNCCQSMFEGCIRLTTVPALAPASAELQSSCYQSMFKGCTSLTTAPDLPANFTNRSAQNAYREMFSGCTSLNSVKCYASTVAGGGAPPTSNWLSNVASSGTFHTPESVSFTWTRNASGIPEGWTVVHDL